MSYIGRDVDNISNVEKLDNITFDGSATYALEKSSVAYTPSGANNILISIDGVVQMGNFSVSTTNIVFDWSPTSSNTCDWILHYGTGLITTPADSSVTASKLGSLAVTGAKLNTDVISAQTALAAEPASTDEFMVSDAGVLKRVDFSHMSNTPAFRVKMTASQSITSDTMTLTAFDSTTFDTDSGWSGASTYKWTVPTGKAGKYLISVKVGSYTASNDMTGFQMELYKNGARHIMQILALYTDQSLRHCPGSFTTLEDLSDGDYLQVYCKIIATSPYIKGNEENAYFEGYRIIGA
jgi:hypothetical protein